MKKIFIWCIISLFVLLVVSKQAFLYSQQILNLTISQAETIFLQNNLQLIAEQYNINIAEANIIQARLFENPELTLEQNIYSAEDNTYLNLNKQNVIQIEQLFELAQKRKKRINFENINLIIVQLQFEDILRELKNTLRENFIELYYLQKSLTIYDKGINYLQKLIGVYDRQYQQGNVSLIESVRLKALLLTLQAERQDISKELINARKELNILLNQAEQTTVNAIIDTQSIRNFSFYENIYSNLINEIENTPQMLIAKNEINLAEANLQLQKTMRIPNLIIGAMYEREGHLRPENVGLYFNIQLPIFNRNQGEIGVAEAEFNQSKINYQLRKNILSNELYAAFSKANEALNFYKSLDNNLESDFETLIEGINLSFERKAINMLEFIDYYETYKEVSLQLQSIEKDTILYIEAINFLLGKDYFRVIN